VAAPSAIPAGRCWSKAEISSTEDSAGTDIIPLESLDFGRPTALVFGNESLGVSREMRAACDGAFTISMRGLSESLNVSVAAAIALHWGRVAREAWLARNRPREDSAVGDGDLTTEELEELEEEYRQRSQDHGFQRRQRWQAQG